MTEIPGDQVINLVERGNRHVHCVSDVLPVENSARDVAFRKDRSLFSKLDLFK